MAGVVLGRDSEQQRLSRFPRVPAGRPGRVRARGRGRHRQDGALARRGRQGAGGLRSRAVVSHRRRWRRRFRTPLSRICWLEVEPEILAALPAPQRDALEIALLRAGPGDAAAESARDRNGDRVRCSTSLAAVDAAAGRGRRCPVARPSVGSGAGVCGSQARGSAGRIPAVAADADGRRRARWVSTVHSAASGSSASVSPG